MALRLFRLTAGLLAVAAAAQVVSVRTAAEGIVRVPLEEYTGWVLAGEAGGVTEQAALEAIAIAARSYARANLGRHAGEGFDFCETTHCQDARPRVSTPKLRSAVHRTENEVLWRNGRIVPGFHHRHCGGRTASPREVWPGESEFGLVSIEDSFCAAAAGARWRASLDLPGVELQIARRTASGRVALLRENGRLVDAEAFHLEIGRTWGWNHLRSRLYDLRREGRRWVFEGHGQGHGVGLCQEGAAARARAGHTAEAILRAYFGEVAIGLSPQHKRWIVERTARVDVRHGGAPGDSRVREMAEAALGEAERISGLKAARRLTVTVFPTLDLYRDLTGVPGFVAASTRGGAIRLQPLPMLKDPRGTLRHEFLHALIGMNAARPLPEWFSEGLALWLERPSAAPVPLRKETEAVLRTLPGERAVRAAYENARGAVAALAARHGRARVMDSLRLGLPE